MSVRTENVDETESFSKEISNLQNRNAELEKENAKIGKDLLNNHCNVVGYSITETCQQLITKRKNINTEILQNKNKIEDLNRRLGLLKQAREK